MNARFYFHNFTEEIFTAYWDGKPYVFKAGARKSYSEGIARVFAKHLVNQELIKDKHERSTSPKKPEEVPLFMDLFNKAFIVEQGVEVDDLEIKDQGEPSMSINVKPAKKTGQPSTVVEAEDQYVKPVRSVK